ncbi:Ig-like domain-containing protein [Desulforudis sp. 1088]|uniref:Ig-like domain-containing protein n=1 Tax=unclassified Candidatus Desulforudis TaxID=2635950 RepID=UPI003CE57A97
MGFKAAVAKVLLVTLVLTILPVLLADANVYTYDDLGRLTAVTYPNGDTLNYSYDAGGNLLSVTFADKSPPIVNSTDPVNGATGVPIDKTIVVTFNGTVVQGVYFSDITVTESTYGSAISHSASITDRTLTIDPASDLANGTHYTVTIPAGAVNDTAGNALASEYSFSFTTGDAPDTVAPAVYSTDPVDGATGVAVNKTIGIIFSETVVESVYFGDITISDGNSVVSYTYTIADTTLTLDPVNDLAYTTIYTVTIPTGAVKDTAGNELASDYVFSFTTGDVLDTTPPTISSTDPADGATGVAVSQTVSVTFSEPIVQGTSFDGISLTDSLGTAVSYSASVSGSSLTIDPISDLVYSTTYTVTVPAGAVNDAAGNALASEYSFSFTTGSVPDTTPPTIISTDPATGATGVGLSKTVTATFSEDIIAGGSFDSITIINTKTGNPVQITRSIQGNILLLNPTSNFAKRATYKVVIPAGAVQDTAGNGFSDQYSFSFTTVR